MPMVSYKTKDGTKKKKFKYSKKGVAEAKKMAKQTGGRLRSIKATHET